MPFCTPCRRSFKTDRALRMHENAVHRYQQPNVPPSTTQFHKGMTGMFKR
jgi:hypothetical protein